MSGVLLLAGSRTEHLEQLRGAIRRTMLGFEEAGDVVTVLDGMRLAAVTFLADSARRQSGSSPAHPATTRYEP
ncbi:hypothetical protein [Actinoplanes xinjiangensis]|uniref:hypothetical protein n=1 Tax=Actinoplanes xinjiangensis TaxID=512350 RepID=UPI00341ED333